jgi:hypothetical protein
VVVEGYDIEDQVRKAGGTGSEGGLGAAGAFGKMQPQNRWSRAGGEGPVDLWAESRPQPQSTGNDTTVFEKAPAGDAFLLQSPFKFFVIRHDHSPCLEFTRQFF